MWKDGKRADEAAEVMKMTSDHLADLKIVDRVFEEPKPVHISDGEGLACELKEAMIAFFKSYDGMTPEAIRSQRYERFRKF